jgi:Tol biopolymer transport system component/DNA-binding winged helix-turn-helix (wHTH) protein
LPPLVHNSRIARFGAFEVDLAAGEVRKSGIRIKLQDRPFQILSVLLEQPGEVVTREELQKRLWPADTFVDFEHGVNTAITKLRQALADEADNPRYIETLPRRGYRFIAPVSFEGNGAPIQPLLADASPTHQDSVPASSTPATASRTGALPFFGPLHFHVRTVIWIAAFVFLSGIAATSWFFYWRSAPRLTLSELRIAPLNGLPRETYAAFSPDGSQVAFVWAAGLHDHSQVYVSQIGAGSPRRLTSSPLPEFAPVWSPDGNYIAFQRYSPERQLSGIYIASSMGGSERKVYTLEPGRSIKEIDWSPDGNSLAFAESDSPAEASTIYLFSLDNFEKHALTFPPKGVLGDSDPIFAPDGKSIAFLRDYLDTQEIFTVPVQGSAPRQITDDKRIILGASWSADGRSLIFSSNRGGPYSLWRISASGGKPERLPIGGASWAIRPTVARKGNRLAYTNLSFVSEIWRAELPATLPDSLSGGRRSRASGDVLLSSPAPGPKLSPPEKFIGSTELEEGPQYSPDGQRIVFQSTRTGSYEIWRCNADGSNLVQLTHFQGPLTGTPRWSPDGSQIVFDSRPSGHSQVFVINAEGGQPRQITTGSTENGVADWSVDGKSIYFGSSRGGSWEIWRVGAQGGTPSQVTTHGGFAPEPSREGKFIYYAKGRDLPGVWRVPVDGGEETKILDAPPASAWAYFVVVERGIYYGDLPNRKNLGIYFYDFKTSKSSPVLLLDRFGSEGAPGLSISPDGRYALYTTLAPPSVHVMLVDNFRY